MAELPNEFGPRLRALRTARGMSLTAFANSVFYSKGHVSRIETGVARPSVAFARLCDVELRAGGRLADLVDVTATKRGSSPDHSRTEDDDGLWIMTMAPDGSNSLARLGRRDVLVKGAVLLAGIGVAGRGAPASVDEVYLAQHQAMLSAARDMGQVVAPRSMLPILTAQAQALRGLARGARGQDAMAVAALSSRTAEYAGWMAQESGDNDLALWWTARAVRVAAEVGDLATERYALVRRALIALYQGNAEQTIALAREAQAVAGTPHRVLALAAQREAQGHALANDESACLRALEVARTHSSIASSEEPPAAVIGTSHVPDPVAAVTGWCLHDLGRPKRAAEVLDGVVDAIDPSSVRARLRFGVRRAMAHAAAGEVDLACELTIRMLAQTSVIDSATIRVDLGRLAATLRRFPSHRGVRDLGPALAMALHKTR